MKSLILRRYGASSRPCPADCIASLNCLRRWVRAFTCCLFFAITAACQGQSFSLVPGHLYVVAETGVKQFDPELNPIGRLSIPGVTVTEGIAFTRDGKMVFGGYYRAPGTSGIGAHVLYEVDVAGQVVRQRDLGFGGLDRASHMAIDRMGRIYVAATDGLVEVAPDFSSQRTLAYDFRRASGVAIDSSNRLYATDQADDRLVIFNQQREAVDSFRIGNVPTGIDFDPQGNLAATLFFDRQLRQIHIDSETTSLLLSGLNEASDIAFADDGTYYLSINAGGLLQHRESNGALIGSAPSGEFGDSIAVMPIPVPEPSTAVLAIVGGLAFVVVRRPRLAAPLLLRWRTDARPKPAGDSDEWIIHSSSEPNFEARQNTKELRIRHARRDRAQREILPLPRL